MTNTFGPIPALDDAGYDNNKQGGWGQEYIDRQEALDDYLAGLKGYTEANLPSGAPTGALAFRTDGARGLMGKASSRWFSLSGGVVNVAEFLAPADGTSDDTAAFQGAHDALPATGGIILAPAAVGYRISKVSITKPGVTVRFAPGQSIKKFGAAGASARGMFEVDALQPAFFRIENGDFDLQRGTIPNGTVSSVIFARRSTHFHVAGQVRVKASSENAFTFRNCGHIYIDDTVHVENIHNNGVEVSITTVDVDGLGNPGPIGLPADEVYVIRGFFTGVDDGLNGAGNGVAVAFANAAAASRTPRFVDIDVRCRDNLRDVHVENNGANSFIRDFRISCVSRNPKQGAVGLVNGKDGEIRAIVEDAGTSGPIGLGNDTYGIVLSGTNTDRVACDLILNESRASATDYPTRPFAVNSASSVFLRTLVVEHAANASQAVAPIAARISSATGDIRIGLVRAKISNPPAGTKGISFVSLGGGAYVTFGEQPRIVGYATDIDGPSGTSWAGPGAEYALTIPLVVRTSGGGVRSDTSDGADTKAIFFNGGGGLNSPETRGGNLRLFGNEHSTQPGQTVVGAGNVAGGKVSFRAGADAEQASVESGVFIAKTSFSHTGSTFGALNATPAAQQANSVDLGTVISTFGFRESGGNPPLNLGSGKLTCGEAEIDGALNHDGSTVGFRGATPQAMPAALTQTYSTVDRTLSAYTADNESSSYAGIDNAQGGTPYAQLTDLNALRAAYENLRAFTEDLAQFTNALVDDMQAVGLEQ